MNLSLTTAAAVIALGASAASADVTITDISARWVAAAYNGAGPGINNGVETGIGTQEISWGASTSTGATGSGRSGYTFQSAGTPFSPAAGEQFNFGLFTHHNGLVDSTFATLNHATLFVTVGVKFAENDPSYYLGASYLFNHTETPNTAGTCPAGSVTVCDDIVSFAPIDGTVQTIEYDGKEYAFFMDHFVTASGATVDNFLTQEERSNTARLVGSFRDVNAVAVPEIGAKGAASALILVLGGMVVLTGARRREQSFSAAA